MIKLIIFDLDGVLIDSRDTHFHTLNEALDEPFKISFEEHFSIYNGLPTKKKLEILHEKKGLSKEKFEEIWNKKQLATIEYMKENYTFDNRLIKILLELKKRGFLIYVASNSIYNTIKIALLKKGFMEYVDYFISNEDVIKPKPDPEMYLKCCQRANVSPKETLILEDSEIGKRSALNSGSHLLEIDNPLDVSLDKILNFIKIISSKEKLNIVIPMAGEGSRFSKVGYTFPKPLIDVKGKPMIQIVVENLNFKNYDSQFIFIVRNSHYEKYNLEKLLKKIAPDCKILITDGLTEGATCSVLLAKEIIDNNEKIIIANSDQFVEWDNDKFMFEMLNMDAGILTFSSNHPKWSYAKINKEGLVEEVAEKKVISDKATVGIYYWKCGSDFVECAENMIKKNIRVNNEFYVCPVFNEAKHKKIKIYNCDRMWGLGTPEDLDYFLKNYKNY